MALIWAPVIAMWVMHIGLYPLYLTHERAVKVAWGVWLVLVPTAEVAYWLNWI
jgi:hypothetical protein